MTPEMTILIAQALLKYGPGVAQGLVSLFGKQVVTAADWDAVFALAHKSYSEYVAPVK